MGMCQEVAGILWESQEFSRIVGTHLNVAKEEATLSESETTAGQVLGA